MMEDFGLKSADYFANMDVEENKLPKRLQDLMDEIDTLSDEFNRVADDEDSAKIQKEIERLDDELLQGLKAFNESNNSEEEDAWPEVNTVTPSADNVAENRDGEDSSSPYFWMQ
jgi:Skp family chaperone for outer membrane proteins